MRLTELLNTENVTISCELFPPKQGAQLDNYKKIVGDMAALKPAYMSVTYGATGGTSDYTVELANEVRNVNHIPALAHLTCASSTKEKVASVIQELKEKQIENVLALRGDIPQNADFPLPNQYKHASELIYDIKSQGDFCIGGACYPEGHPESQMFFDNNILYNFMYKALKHGIDVPVVAGIMPITNANQVKRSIALSGSLVPRRFLAIVDRFGSDPAAMKQAGIAYATDQIIDLIANGVNHVHIYTMNKPDVAGAILENLSDIYVRDQYGYLFPGKIYSFYEKNNIISCLEMEINVKKQEEIFREIQEMMGETKEGRIRWSVEVMTTEANPAEEKPVEHEDGLDWTIDECYVSYYCKYKGKDFCLITYEMLKTANRSIGEQKVKSSNMVFLPPLGMRFFDIHALLPYSIEVSNVLLDAIHRLWVMLLDMYKVDKGSIYLNVRPGTLTIEDEKN